MKKILLLIFILNSFASFADDKIDFIETIKNQTIIDLLKPQLEKNSSENYCWAENDEIIVMMHWRTISEKYRNKQRAGVLSFTKIKANQLLFLTGASDSWTEQGFNYHKAVLNALLNSDWNISAKIEQGLESKFGYNHNKTMAISVVWLPIAKLAKMKMDLKSIKGFVQKYSDALQPDIISAMNAKQYKEALNRLSELSKHGINNIEHLFSVITCLHKLDNNKNALSLLKRLFKQKQNDMNETQLEKCGDLFWDMKEEKLADKAYLMLEVNY